MGLLNYQHNMLMAAPHIETFVGDEASFYMNVPSPLKSFVVEAKPVQYLNGFDSAYLPGKSNNLIPDGTDTSNGYVAGYILRSDGTTESSSAGVYISEYFGITEGETYTWSGGNSDTNTSSICFYDSNKTFISGIAAAKALPKTFTAPADAVYCRSSQYYVPSSVLQLEHGSLATTPKPYSNVCPIYGWTGSRIYNEKKNGGPIKWNQLIQNGDFSNGKTSWTFSTYHNATVTEGVLSTYATTKSNRKWTIGTAVQFKAGHVYIVKGNFRRDYTGTDSDIATNYVQFGSRNMIALRTPSAGSTVKMDSIVVAVSHATTLTIGTSGSVSPAANAPLFSVWNIFVCDLTEMFGGDKADYIYNLEKASAGSGIAYFSDLFPNDYYSYNSGEDTCVSDVNNEQYGEYIKSWEAAAGTVYGCVYDVLNGPMSVNRVYIDLKSLTWSFRKDNIFSVALPYSYKLVDISNQLCDCLPVAYAGKYTEAPVNKLSLYNGEAEPPYDTLYLNIPNITTVADLTTWLTANDPHVCLVLETPSASYNLGGLSINTFKGNNNITTDCGTVSVTCWTK